MITRNDLRKSRNKFQIPANLVGKWNKVPSLNNFGFHIQASGECSAFGPPLLYSIAQNVISIGNQSFDRVSGSGLDIVGVWREQILAEEMTLRDDMSYGYYVPPQNADPGENYNGFYRLETNPDKLQTFEVRSFVSEAGGQLEFAPVWGGPPNVFNFTLIGTQLSLTNVGTGGVYIYEYDGP